jgi:hypothetical protein
VNRRKPNQASIEKRVSELVLAPQNGRIRRGELIGYSSSGVRVDSPARCFIKRIQRDAITGEFVLTLMPSPMPARSSAVDRSIPGVP